MPRVFTGIAATTELEALNEMLAAIGEPPVLQAELESPSLADVDMAVNLLTNTLREVLSIGWVFNTEFGYELAPTSTVEWTDTDGDTTTLNVWEIPTTLLSFRLTNSSEQSGLQLEPRISRQYQNTGEYVRVFYDRELNRDGLDSADFTHLYIDPIFATDFEDSPETFRRYVTIKAARRLQARLVGSRALDGFTESDERLALRNLKREQGRIDDYNIFNNPTVNRHLGLGYRTWSHEGYGADNRDTPNKA